MSIFVFPILFSVGCLCGRPAVSSGGKVLGDGTRS